MAARCAGDLYYKMLDVLFARVGAWAEADDRFHREWVRLGRNARLSMGVSVMRDQVRRARATTLFMRPKPKQSNEDHRVVYQAIARGDAQVAHDTHHAHRQAARPQDRICAAESRY